MTTLRFGSVAVVVVIGRDKPVVYLMPPPLQTATELGVDVGLFSEFKMSLASVQCC
jgi:hypothetical protein